MNNGDVRNAASGESYSRKRKTDVRRVHIDDGLRWKVVELHNAGLSSPQIRTSLIKAGEFKNHHGPSLRAIQKIVQKARGFENSDRFQFMDGTLWSIGLTPEMPPDAVGLVLEVQQAEQCSLTVRTALWAGRLCHVKSLDNHRKLRLAADIYSMRERGYEQMGYQKVDTEELDRVLADPEIDTERALVKLKEETEKWARVVDRTELMLRKQSR